MIKEKMKQLIGKSINKYNTQYVKDVVSELKFKEQYQGRIIDCMVGEVDDNYIETPETDSSIVKLEHSKEGLIKVHSIKGKTILVDADGNETDTPREGCRLVSVGEEDNKLIILSKNKNLVKKNNIIKGTLKWGSDYNIFKDEIGDYNGKNIMFKECIKVEPNTSYYIQYQGNKSFHFMKYDKQGNHIVGSYPSIKNGIITTDNNTYYINIYLVGGDVGENYDLDGLIKTLKETFMIEKTNKKNEYTEGKHHKTEILLNEPLRSLPNGVCDEILGNQLIRRVGKVVLDGKNVTSIGIINDNVVDVLYFDKTVTNKKFINYGSEGQQLIKSNIYRTGINANNWNSTTSENTLVNTNSGGFWIFLPKFTVLNIEDARNYMNNNPTQVIYELAEPIIEELPNSITLQGFDDTTIYIENAITPTVTYGYNALIPYKEEVLNQQQEVETNTLDIEQNIIPYLMDMEFNLMLMEDE